MAPRCIDLLLCCCLAAPLAAQASVAVPHFDSGAVARLHFGDATVAVVRLVAPVTRDSTTYRYCLFRAPFCTARHVIERPALNR